jgi:DNA polymerase-1
MVFWRIGMLFVLDANNLIHAYFHIRTNDDKYDVTERVLHRLERIRNWFQGLYPDCSFCAVFDNGKETFRYMIYPKYKANREKFEELPEVLDSVFDAVTNDSDWISIRAPYLCESDDLIASLASQYPGRVIIHSSDKDMRQCLVDGRVLIIKRSFVNESGDLCFEYYSAKNLMEEYGFTPDRWVDYQCIAGDNSDNLAELSWKWAGDNLAKKIVSSGDTIDSVSVGDERLDKRQTDTLHLAKKNYPLMKQLVTLRNDIPFPFELLHLTEIHK